MCYIRSASMQLSEHLNEELGLHLWSLQGGRCLQVVRFSLLLVPWLPYTLSRVTVCVCSRRLNLLERVSADAVTTILHKMIEERMEQRCRGEYEHSFLNEFQEVRQVCGQRGPFTGDVQLLPLLL